MKTTLLALAVTVCTAITAQAVNQFSFNTPYPVWHYFDEDLNPGIGTAPFYASGDPQWAEPGPDVCNRGIDSLVRACSVFEHMSNGVYCYDVTSFDTQGWYVLQIDGDFKVEMSTDTSTWITVLTAPGWTYWTNKGPNESMSPYFIDLAPYLPSTAVYVRISDNTPGDGNGARALNALLTERCYPQFYAGGAEPNDQRRWGDQQFLFIKDETSDRINDGRFADGSNCFVYKFDLPDDRDDCRLFANVSGEYLFELSTDWDFSNVLYTSQNAPGVYDDQSLNIDLEPILTQSYDNVIYSRMSDVNPADPNGGLLRELWITPQVLADDVNFNASDEIETSFLWGNWNTEIDVTARYADGNNSFIYRFNVDSSNSIIYVNTKNEYLIQGSSNSIDWVDLFVAASAAPLNRVEFNPFTGYAAGIGVQPGIPPLVNPYYDGWTNVFFLRVADSDTSTGLGGFVESVSVSQPPQPPTPKTIYPVWHYFDLTLSDEISGEYYYDSGSYGTAGPDNAKPNRGIDSTGRKAMFMDGNNKLIMRYDMAPGDTQAWYVLQIDNNFSVQFSTDMTNWTAPFTNTAPYSIPSEQSSNWQDKPLTNMAPYYFDLSSLLPADTVYARIGDASTGNGWGGRAWNALVTKRGYPCLFGGGNEPDSSGRWGDQQFLFIKDWTSDRENDGRFADERRRFVYKLDLPDGEDECLLHARIDGEFLLWVSTNCVFSTIDLAVSNNPGDTTMRLLALPLSNVLAKTVDNLIYVGIGDSDPSGGSGGNLFEFWVVDHPVLTQASFNAGTEGELPFLWENVGAQLDIYNGRKARFADGDDYFIYRFRLTDISDPTFYSLEIDNEYRLEFSTDAGTWYTIFDAGVSNRTKNVISYNPFTGEAYGIGAAASPPVLFTGGEDIYELYVRVRDTDPTDGYGGRVYRAWTSEIPEPVVRVVLMLGVAGVFFRRSL